MKTDRLSILLVAASENSIALIKNHIGLMEERASLQIVQSLEEAKNFLTDQNPDLMLVAFDLPDGSGTDLLAGEEEDSAFPTILLASHRADQFAMETFQSGAMDYLPLTSSELSDLPYIIERTLREWQRIHKCRQAEKDLRRKEERFRLLFENMTEALAIDEIVCDALGNPVDWRVLDINPAYEKIMHIPREKAVGRLASDLYGPTMDLKSTLENYAKVALTGEPTLMEIFFPLSQRNLLISVFSLGEGRFATLSTDITKRHQIEAKNERLLAELEATIRAIAEAVVIYRPNGEIVRMNPAAEKLLGYSNKDREKPFTERISHLTLKTPEGESFPLVETMHRVFAGETFCGVITVLHKADGSTVWTSNSAAPIRGTDGTLFGAVGVSTDITAIHELQEQRDLTLHSISHDLRSPMAIIQGYAELLQDQLSKLDNHDNWMRLTKELLKGTHRMSSMIDDLVETARAEGGQIQLEKSLVHLDKRVEDLVNSYAKVLDKGRLQIHIPDNLPPLFVDPERLDRILINLLSNALKYSPQQCPVKLSAAATPDFVTIVVSDSGQGIDPEDVPHIFDRFFRGRRQRKVDSVGLGLFITKKLVEAHGGWIGVESQPEAGSHFTVTLPFSPECH